MTLQKDRKDAQARRLEVLQTAMERTRKKHLFDMVVNPRSFTQVRRRALGSASGAY